MSALWQCGDPRNGAGRCLVITIEQLANLQCDAKRAHGGTENRYRQRAPNCTNGAGIQVLRVINQAVAANKTK